MVARGWVGGPTLGGRASLLPILMPGGIIGLTKKFSKSMKFVEASFTFSGKRNGSRGHASKAVKAHRVLKVFPVQQQFSLEEPHLREPGSESDPRETDAERGTVCSLEQLLFQGGSAAVALPDICVGQSSTTTILIHPAC